LSELKKDFGEEAKKEENSEEKGRPIRSAVEDVYAENGLNQAAYFANWLLPLKTPALLVPSSKTHSYPFFYWQCTAQNTQQTSKRTNSAMIFFLDVNKLETTLQQIDKN
jgi:hypothetical protein